MNCFIDDYNLVRIESKKYIDSVYLLDEKLMFDYVDGKFQYFKSKGRIPLHLAKALIVNEHEYPLYIGLVTLKPDFNDFYRYDGKLGAIYQESYTEFSVFSPVAKGISLVLDGSEYEMEYDLPIWKIKVKGNFENSQYYYLVDLNEKVEKVIDPYAIAGNNDYSVVLDLSKTKAMKYDYIKNGNHINHIIYEGHIRDLTTYLDVPSKKLYKGLIEPSKQLGSTVLNYIKDLGMTHLQLLPVQDFMEVDAYNKDDHYNWGYNPQQYFTLTGWYSANPNNYYERINEFKEVIDYAHSIGLAVTLDVVYNHVYQRGLFPYDKLVPGYFYRHDKNFKATNASLVGNEIETRNYMVRKLIVDSLVYLTDTFKLDGFRFDLMGLMDIETMLEIEDKLKELNPQIALYGEGWNIVTEVKEELRSNMRNNEYFPYYGHFNDYYRDVLRGSQHHMSKGFLAGARDRLFDVLMALKGSSNIFFDPNQSLNFIECHDNYTYHDFLVLTNTPLEEMKYYLDFANHFIAISKGIAFYHAGQELYRTKKLVRDSYNKDDTYNGIKWNIPSSLYNLKKILEIRKKYFNKDDEILATKFVRNLILYEVVNKDVHLKIYIKNDFKHNKIKEEYKNIFASQEITHKLNIYEFSKPGIYIFKGER